MVLSQISRDTEALASEFSGVFSHETVERYVQESLAAFRDSKITTFLPLIVRRFARQQLRAFGQAEGVLLKPVPEVLFVCVHNAGRSQMAAALLNHHAGGRVHVRSGGSAPGEAVNPAVVKAMQEVGLDLSQEFPKPVTDEGVRAADVVITMGCGDACPIYPGKRYEDWQLTDPHGQGIDAVRAIRDDIDGRVRALLADLTAGKKEE
ncbi:arsenate reductase ArsC [soil metagenome]